MKSSREGLRHATVMSRPPACVGAHPAYRFNDLVVRATEIAGENRLVMSNPVSEAPERIESAVDHTPGSWTADAKRSMERGPPESCVIAGAKQANPKSKWEFRHDISRSGSWFVGRIKRLGDGVGRVGVEGNLIVGEPIVPVLCRKPQTQPVAEANLHALKWSIKCLGDAHVALIQRQRRIKIAKAY